MRKVTGYIGALIVVIALMGSILAGYALNINGQSTVVNEYENVTDVSGLYSHTDQKTYIDYNPASNYIGYNSPQTYENTVPSEGFTLKDVKSGTIVITPGNPVTVNVNGVIQTGKPPYALYTIFMCDMAAIEVNNDNTLNFLGMHGVVTNINTPITINITNTTVFTVNGETSNYGPNTHNLVYWVGDDWDYIEKKGIKLGNTDPIMAYVNDLGDILSVGNVNSTNRQFTSAGTTIYWRNSGTTGTLPLEKNGTQIYNDVYSMNLNYSFSNGDMVTWAVYFPKYVTTQAMGIDYTESNRVNNYPVIVNAANTTTTYTTINLQNISATDYWPNGNNGNALGPGMALNYLKEIDGNNVIWEWYTQMPNLVSYSYDPNVAPVVDDSGLHSYRLSDILNSYSMPANARTLTIDFNSGTSKNISENTHNQYYNVNLDYNFAGVIEISQNKSNNSFILVNDVKDQKDYIVYDVERRTATVYDYNGVAKRTDSPDNILIGFDKVSTAIYSVVGVYSTSLMAGFAPFFVNTSDRPQPTMNITALSVDPGEIDYIDITKGYSIKSINTSDVIWNNEYENGNIQLLFRSLDTSETYHNTLTISGNTIDVDYTASKFYVSLNGDDAVNIGTWRNIILDIDLENGTLNAIPVRTFNSFTNVQMDNAVIPIGELVNAAPTNTITWSATPNSLLFNVYLTSVFMDTYGVVMADPTLNITDYFTNLDNFYRLKLSKFSVIGDSITINGQTYPVSDNTVTIDNKTLQIKEVYVTYADGHAYIEDSNTVIDLGEITSNIVSMAGAWYFETYLEKGYTQLKQIYTWDWSDFILDNTQFCIFYIGLAVAGLIVAKRFCSMSIIDYAVFIVSIVIALGVQVIA